MIRESSLSIKFGGDKKIKTYCLYYQKPPRRFGILCRGILDYPPCSDFTRCISFRPTTAQMMDLEEELKKKDDGVPLLEED
jgi:hypothetical protein